MFITGKALERNNQVLFHDINDIKPGIYFKAGNGELYRLAANGDYQGIMHNIDSVPVKAFDGDNWDIEEYHGQDWQGLPLWGNMSLSGFIV